MKNFSQKKFPKISLIGAGNIGGTCALLLAMKIVGDIVLFDIVEGLPQGKMLDLAACAPITQGDFSVIGTNSYSDISDSDVIIITAGIPRTAKKISSQKNFQRSDLLAHNSKIIEEVAKNIKKYSPNAFVITTTNPLDAMTWFLQKTSGLDKKMVVGMAGGLDSSRFSYFLGQELKISPKNIHITLIGEHGNTMVPLIRFSHVNDTPLDRFLSTKDNGEEIINDAIKKTKTAGGEIVKLMQTSAYYSPAAAVIEIAMAYLNNTKQTILCSTLLEGEYDVHDLCVGVPAVIGNQGVEQINQLNLQDNEKKEFKSSVASIDQLVSILKETIN